MSGKQPSAKAAQRYRRKSPVFIDEPIQWHLRHGRHDRCLWCGLQELERRGSRKRICGNEVCQSVFEISMSQADWQDYKLMGLEDEIDMASEMDVVSVVRHGEERFDLRNAQIRSDTGRAFTRFINGLAGEHMLVYWHRAGKLPEREDARPACAAGSDYWREIRSLRGAEVWIPEVPLNAMEVLAKAYGTDEPMFAIMGG